MMRDIDSLHGIIKVKRPEDPPDMVFALITKFGEDPFDPETALKIKAEGRVPEVALTIESFIRMSSLPKDLQNQIREHLKIEKASPRLHKDTQTEVKQQNVTTPVIQSAASDISACCVKIELLKNCLREVLEAKCDTSSREYQALTVREAMGPNDADEWSYKLNNSELLARVEALLK
jgi:hypothetical protein